MTACAALACDHCPKPGACCQHIPIIERGAYWTESTHPTALHVLVAIAASPQLHLDGLAAPLPFLPLQIDGLGIWRLRCPELTDEGRCGIYDRRPWLCSHFQPGESAICALHPDHDLVRLAP